MFSVSNTIELLNLPEPFPERIKSIISIISDIYPKSDIHLFGSCAKGRVNKDSDIDILILLDEEPSRMDRVNLRTAIDDYTDYSLEFDLLLYSKKRFNEILSIGSVFETRIFNESVRLQ